MENLTIRVCLVYERWLRKGKNTHTLYTQSCLQMFGLLVSLRFFRKLPHLPTTEQLTHFWSPKHFFFVTFCKYDHWIEGFLKVIMVRIFPYYMFVAHMFLDACRSNYRLDFRRSRKLETWDVDMQNSQLCRRGAGKGRMYWNGGNTHDLGIAFIVLELEQ